MWGINNQAAFCFGSVAMQMVHPLSQLQLSLALMK
jgi:hypothetical protein